MDISGTLCDAAQICQQVSLTLTGEAPKITDYSYLGKVWGLAFSSVMSLYLFSLGIGTVLRFIKNV
ncbi:hypothetical protein GUU82_24595 (plasmid) [Escherichia coli]|uniref:hypothetical protein n=2 Tax=Enterobacteriaceae TaxID=543 RepID=UPI001364059C|nr:hypothetical protein [Escherichia coli]QHJ59369.1 hypothetical protein GUU82_24595 [Escherichia coli]